MRNITSLEYGQKHKLHNRKSARKDSNGRVLSRNAVGSVKEAMEELTVDNFYGPYDLILQPSAFLDAHTFIGNTTVMQIDKIRELIGGKVYVTPALKAADGGIDSALLMETGAENADLCVAQDLKTFYIQLKDMNHFFKCYEASGAEDKAANSDMRDHGHNVGEIVMPKFKIVKVHSFRIGNKRYSKGEVVELSEEDAERFKGADFLEPMEEQRKPEKIRRNG